MPVTNYLWDPLTDNVLMETDENGATTAVYTHEPTHRGRIISQKRGDKTSYYHADALGNTMLLTDDNGAVTDTYNYDAWGNEIAHTGTTENPFRWGGGSGYYYDAELGTYYVRARSYQAETAQWTSKDKLMDGETLNFLAYVSNRPTLFSDPSGNRPIPFEFNAFIHQKWGDWLHEPIPFSPWDYEGNRRDFGGGETKIRARGTVESTSLGRITMAKVEYDGTPSVRRRQLGVNSWLFQQQQVRIDWRTETTSLSSVSNGCHTTVRVSASGPYPFPRVPFTNINPAPKINFEVGFQFKVIGPDHVRLKVSGWHNQFPNYEALVDGQRPVYTYDASPWGGPNPVNLGLQWPFDADSRVIVAPTSCVCPRPALLTSSWETGYEPESAIHEWVAPHPDIS